MRNQKAVSGCASLTARVSHVWESYPGDTPTASVIITIIRMRIIAAERFMIMVSRRLVIEGHPQTGSVINADTIADWAACVNAWTSDFRRINRNTKDENAWLANVLILNS
jgi:hypothetical protein